jgi:hypothetical protein
MLPRIPRAMIPPCPPPGHYDWSTVPEEERGPLEDWRVRYGRVCAKPRNLPQLCYSETMRKMGTYDGPALPWWRRLWITLFG